MTHIYDDSNISESYAGPTTPLTFHFARYVYSRVYPHFCAMMGVPDRVVHAHPELFENLLVPICSRITYDLSHWYRLVSFLPGYRYNKVFFDRMLGVQDKGEATVAALPEEGNAIARAAAKAKLALQSVRILWSFVWMGRSVERFCARFDAVLRTLPQELDGKPIRELRAVYERLDQELIGPWKVPIANDFAVMVSTGVADAFFRKRVDAAGAYHFLRSDARKPLAALDPGDRVAAIAEAVGKDLELTALCRSSASDADVRSRLMGEPRFAPVAKLFNDHVAAYGHRSPNELKLESPTMRERPELLVGIVRGAVVGGARTRGAAATTPAYRSGVDRFVGNELLAWARVSIARREETRLRRSAIFGYVRHLLLAAGKELAAKGRIERGEDVFFLTPVEIFDVGDGDLRAAALVRSERFVREREITPPHRIVTEKTPAEVTEDLLNAPIAADPVESVPLRGMVASRGAGGSFTGEALVMRAFDPAAPFAGKIVVVSHTDPGWALIFPFVRGLIVERGGMLSHAAIVARELGIPCVIGVARATERVTNGAQVTLDMATGAITTPV